MSRSREFKRAFPEGTFLEADDPETVERYARSRGWISEGDRLLSLARAGAGNMNLTLRLVTERGSFVLKQSRPWVEKYPSIAAPPGRSSVEIAFYQEASKRPELAGAMPRLLGSDPESGALALEDLGEAQDLTPLYRDEALGGHDLGALAAYLATLHQPLGELPEERQRLFANREMRALNHEHIFRLPLAPDNGLDLDALSPGLDAAARSLKRDERYVGAVAELGLLYLSDGDVLVHGDYFPGSWLRTDEGIRVIDPEFCFLGTPAFDLGFMLGHLHLAREPESMGEELLERYTARTGAPDELSRLARRFAGIEIMRRLIGVAQLPLDDGIDRKRELLEKSRALVLS